VTVLAEVFVARVFGGGKVTVPKRVRELLDVVDGDYVRLSLVEVVKRKRDAKPCGNLLEVVQAVYFASHPLLRHFTFFCFVFETLRLDVALAFVDLAAKFRDAVESFLN
jgi:bifunctional DNA-binding transcriptional regulator/antitoxin component of YhaV-PrlF toxin-antitoxin module